MTLFDYAERYPRAPGWKAPGTSQEAAQAIKPRCGQLQSLCIDALAKYGSMTADEIADRIQADKLAVRPRCTELLKLGRIVDTGERRRNESTRRATVYALAPVAIAA